MYVSRIFGHVSRHEIHKALQFKDPLPRTSVKMYLLVSKSGPSMILMGDRGTEERHKPITEELVDGAFVPMHLVECYLKKAIEERVHGLRSDTLRNGSGVR